MVCEAALESNQHPSALLAKTYRQATTPDLFREQILSFSYSVAVSAVSVACAMKSFEGSGTPARALTKTKRKGET
jgi:hypothetical protein